MFEDLMSLMAGFLTAYLILRAVRSFRGGVGILVLGFGLKVYGQDTFQCHNDSACYVSFCFWDGSYGCGNPTPVLAPGTSYDMHLCASANWYVEVTLTNSCSVLGTLGNYPRTCAGVTTPLHFSSGGGCSGLPAVTNWGIASSYVTPGGTNVMFDQFGKLVIYTNGVPAGTNIFNMGPGGVTNSLVLTNPIAGYTGPFTFSLLAPGNGTNDFVPIVVGTNAGNPNSSGFSVAPATNADTFTWSNPVNNIPKDPSVTNLNSQIQSQMQNQALLNQVGNLQAALQKGDNGVSNAVASLAGSIQGNTNVSDAGTHSALGVVTQQLGSLQGLASNLNLGLMGNGSNVAGWLPTLNSNLASPDWGMVSNALFGNGLNDWLAASNALKSGWLSEMGGIEGTNSTVKTNVDTPGGEGNLTVDLAGPGGATYTLDFNPFHQTSGPWLAFLQAIPWIRYWVSWAIAFAVWWLCVQRLDELVISGSLAAAMSASKGAGSAVGYGVKLVAGPFISVLITAVIASLPTAAMAWMTTRGIANPLSAPSFLGTLGDIGSMGSSFTVMVEEFASFLLIVWPFDVLLVGFANWVTFYFTAGYFYRMMTAALRCFGFYVPVVVVGFCSLDIRGEQIRFENFTGSAVVVSNGARVLSLPPGVSDKMVIPYGNWITASNGFTVNADGYQVVRAYGDTNNVGVVYFEQADGYSAYQWWMWGMNCGFLIFGTTWAISAARSGILLRVRE